jgi:hypothetical protein
MIGAASGSANRQFQLISTTTITSTGSQDYTVPSGTAYLVFEYYGAGGGGGGGNQSQSGRSISYKGGGGGGGGSNIIHRYASELLIDGDIIRFTVGAGGVEGGAVATAGGTGGSTSPITHRDSGLTIKHTFAGPTAGGGKGGLSPTTFSAGGQRGGVASGANLFNTDGYDGGNNHASLGNGGAGGGYTVISTALQDPEESFIATTINLVLDNAGWGISTPGAGGIASTSTAATNGSSPSNGGGGGYNKGFALNPSGGSGGNGKVIVRAYG